MNIEKITTKYIYACVGDKVDADGFMNNTRYAGMNLLIDDPERFYTKEDLCQEFGQDEEYWPTILKIDDLDASDKIIQIDSEYFSTILILSDNFYL